MSNQKMYIMLAGNEVTIPSVYKPISANHQADLSY